MQVDIRGGDFQEGHSIDWDLGKIEDSEDKILLAASWQSSSVCMELREDTLYSESRGSNLLLPILQLYELAP